MPVRCIGMYNFLSGYMDNLDNLQLGDLCNSYIIYSNTFWNRIPYYLDMYCCNLYTTLF
jgi:hypothetical protein